MVSGATWPRLLAVAFCVGAAAAQAISSECCNQFCCADFCNLDCRRPQELGPLCAHPCVSYELKLRGITIGHNGGFDPYRPQPVAYQQQPPVITPAPYVAPMAPPTEETCADCIISWQQILDWLRSGGAWGIIIFAASILFLGCVLCCLLCAAAGGLGGHMYSNRDKKDLPSLSKPPKGGISKF